MAEKNLPHPPAPVQYVDDIWTFLTAWEELKKVHNLQEKKEGVEA